MAGPVPPGVGRLPVPAAIRAALRRPAAIDRRLTGAGIRPGLLAGGSGAGTGFPPSCQSAIATKTPAKPLATSLRPNKHAPTNHDAAERRVGGTEAARTGSRAAHADTCASTAAARTTRAAATQRIFRRSPQGLGLPPCEKCPLHPPPRPGGASRRLETRIVAHPLGRQHADSVRRGSAERENGPR
jgi:hypothetical protein